MKCSATFDIVLCVSFRAIATNDIVDSTTLFLYNGIFSIGLKFEPILIIIVEVSLPNRESLGQPSLLEQIDIGKVFSLYLSYGRVYLLSDW